MHRLGRTLLLAVACTLVAACTDGDDPVLAANHSPGDACPDRRHTPASTPNAASSASNQPNACRNAATRTTAASTSTAGTDSAR